MCHVLRLPSIGRHHAVHRAPRTDAMSSGPRVVAAPRRWRYCRAERSVVQVEAAAPDGGFVLSLRADQKVTGAIAEHTVVLFASHTLYWYVTPPPLRLRLST